MIFCSGCFWKSSTEPRDDKEVEEADPVGESSGVPAVELAVVEGLESMVTLRRSADSVGSAVVLIRTVLLV